MKRRLVLVFAVCAAVGAAACSERTRPALNLDGNRLTIYNDSDETWSNVEVILNQHFHIQPKDSLPEIFGGSMGAWLLPFSSDFSGRPDAWDTQ